MISHATIDQPKACLRRCRVEPYPQRLRHVIPNFVAFRAPSPRPLAKSVPSAGAVAVRDRGHTAPEWSAGAAGGMIGYNFLHHTNVTIVSLNSSLAYVSFWNIV